MIKDIISPYNQSEMASTFGLGISDICDGQIQKMGSIPCDRHSKVFIIMLNTNTFSNLRCKTGGLVRAITCHTTKT